jgi:hypothetical protein
MKPERQSLLQTLLALTIVILRRAKPSEGPYEGCSADAVERTITLAASMYPHPHHRDFTLTVRSLASASLPFRMTTLRPPWNSFVPCGIGLYARFG